MTDMQSFDLTQAGDFPAATPAPGARAAVILDERRAKVRRIALDAGGSIPPCEMREDVVFVVLSGAVVFTCGAEEQEVCDPGAVYIPGGATTRSFRALEPSLVLAVLCRGPGEGADAAD